MVGASLVPAPLWLLHRPQCVQRLTDLSSLSRDAHTQGQDHPHSYFKGYEYSRTNNPTRAAFEQAVASAESGKYGARHWTLATHTHT